MPGLLHVQLQDLQNGGSVPLPAICKTGGAQMIHHQATRPSRKANRQGPSRNRA